MTTELKAKRLLVTPLGQFSDFFFCLWFGRRHHRRRGRLIGAIIIIGAIIGARIPRGISSRSRNPPWDFKSEPPRAPIGAPGAPIGATRLSRRSPVGFQVGALPQGSDLKSCFRLIGRSSPKYLQISVFGQKTAKNIFLSESRQESVALIRTAVSLLVFVLCPFVCLDFCLFYVFSYVPDHLPRKARPLLKTPRSQAPTRHELRHSSRSCP